ncbi:MAG TPA: NADPH-dependent F420 reductase [Candidatus Limnocylindrales bacterium]|nr:NADPH-dependent F420 reductase [Candidatus Limnocylindrales bacterium]
MTWACVVGSPERIPAARGPCDGRLGCRSVSSKPETKVLCGPCQTGIDLGQHLAYGVPTSNSSWRHQTSPEEGPPMNIAIIGAGNVGQALASSFKRAGHEVTISAAHPESATEVASKLGTKAAGSNTEAVSTADLVVLAVPATALESVAREIGPNLAGKVVVDVTNRPTPDPAGSPTSVAEELQERLPEARVVKAFNTAFASRQAEPVVHGIPADGFVAADDEGAKKTVLDAVASIGFRPVDAGSLAAARTLEGMAWLNISRNMAGGTWQDAWVLVGPDSSN